MPMILKKLDDKIVVRQSAKGEKVILLDGSEVELDADTVLITDGSGPIGMGGVMGGVVHRGYSGEQRYFP